MHSPLSRGGHAYAVPALSWDSPLSCDTPRCHATTITLSSFHAHAPAKGSPLFPLAMSGHGQAKS